MLMIKVFFFNRKNSGLLFLIEIFLLLGIAANSKELDYFAELELELA